MALLGLGVTEKNDIGITKLRKEMCLFSLGAKYQVGYCYKLFAEALLFLQR